LLLLLSHTEDRAKQSNLSTQKNKNEEEANNSQEEESELPRKVRNKKRTSISYEEPLLQILRQKKIDDIDADEEKSFLLSLLPFFWRFNDEQNLCLGWKFSKLCYTSNCNKIWIRIHLAPCLPFKKQTYPSKHIACCNQSSKSLISNFYTEFRNSFPVLVQLLQSSLKGHELPQLSSFAIKLVPVLSPVKHFSCEVNWSRDVSFVLSVGSTAHL